MSLIEPLKNLSVWKSPSVVVLVLANLIPLAGVLFFGWEVFPIMFLFWFENVVVGVFHALKMLMAGGGPQAMKFFFVPFFCLHYGIFTAVHGGFVFAMFTGGHGYHRDSIWGQIAELHLDWAVLGLVVSHGFSFVTNYLLSGAYRTAVLPVLMMQPYGRVVVLHLAILGGGFLIVLLGAPTMSLVLLIALKIGLDVLAHAKQHGIGGGLA